MKSRYRGKELSYANMCLCVQKISPLGVAFSTASCKYLALYYNVADENWGLRDVILSELTWTDPTRLDRITVLRSTQICNTVNGTIVMLSYCRRILLLGSHPSYAPYLMPDVIQLLTFSRIFCREIARSGIHVILSSFLLNAIFPGTSHPVKSLLSLSLPRREYSLADVRYDFCFLPRATLCRIPFCCLLSWH